MTITHVEGLAARIVAADAGLHAAITARLGAAGAIFGGDTPDILVCMADAGAPAEDFRAAVSASLAPIFGAVRPVLAGMRARGRGTVILAAPRQTDAEDCPVRAAVAGALATLTRSIAYQYGPFGIRANALLPGTLATDADIATGTLLFASPDSSFTTGTSLTIGQPIPSRWPA